MPTHQKKKASRLKAEKSAFQNGMLCVLINLRINLTGLFSKENMHRSGLAHCSVCEYVCTTHARIYFIKAPW